VAYGSNLCAERMLAYLRGADQDALWGFHRGAADPAPPSADQMVTVPHPVRFGGHSQRWGGGVAWCPHQSLEPQEFAPLGRAWRITRGQLADVVAQENQQETNMVHLPDTFPSVGQAVTTLEGWIDLLISLEDLDGVPAVTLGSTNPPDPGSPGPTYRAVLATGMSEMGCTPAEINQHLNALDRTPR